MHNGRKVQETSCPERLLMNLNFIFGKKSGNSKFCTSSSYPILDISLIKLLCSRPEKLLHATYFEMFNYSIALTLMQLI